MTLKKIAVVTGANKGIGYAIVKGLCEKFDGDVFLTARDLNRGQKAIETLKLLGCNPLFHQLDITDQESVNSFRNYIKGNYDGISILINNAGINASSKLTIGEQAEQDINVNYFGTLKVCEALFPLLKNNAKVVNISSSAGRLQRIPSENIRKKFKDPDLTINSLNKLMEQYVKDAQSNLHREEGWGESAYVVSKVGVTALTNIQQQLFDKEKPYRNISVNSVHPGYVITDMNRNGVISPDEGAKAALFLALEASLKGKYVWFDCHVVDWDGPLSQ